MTIAVTLTAGITYNINISNRSVKDINNNYADAVSFSFTTKYPQPADGKYEAEHALMSANNDILTSINGYSGTGYIGVFPGADAYVPLNLKVSQLADLICILAIQPPTLDLRYARLM